MTHAETARRIVRIVSIVDTREYEEQGDRWVPIPGSGVALRCSRCNREHEVHATVELSDGATLVVGTGCASRESADLAAAFRSGESRAKRVAALQYRIAKLETLVSEAARINAEVDGLPVPEITVEQAEERRYVFRCGDGWSWGHSLDRFYADERRRCAVNAWRRNRAAERGMSAAHDAAGYELSDATRALARAMAA